MAITRVGGTTSASALSSASATSASTGTNTLNSIRIVSIVVAPSGNQVPTITSVTDTLGGTWVPISDYYSSPATTTSVNGCLTQIWWRTTPQATTAYTFTVNLSASSIGIAARSNSYTNVELSKTPEVVYTRGTAQNLSPITLPTINPIDDMLILHTAYDGLVGPSNPTSPTSIGWGNNTPTTSGGTGNSAMAITQNNGNQASLTTGVSVSGQTVGFAAPWANLGVVIYGVTTYQITCSATIDISSSNVNANYIAGPQLIGTATGIQTSTISSFSAVSGLWLNTPIRVNDKVIVLLAFDPRGASVPTVNVSATNFTFSPLGPIVDSPSVTSNLVGTKIQAWIGNATANGTTSVTVTATWAGSSPSQAASSVYAFRHLGTSQRNPTTSVIGATTTSPPYSLTTPSGNATDLIVAMQGQEGSTGNVTYSTDSVNGIWQGQQTRASTGTVADSSINVMSQFKILTGDGTQTAVFGNDISVGRNYAIASYVLSFAPPALFAGWGIPL
jgi:hypothetical protein